MKKDSEKSKKTVAKEGPHRRSKYVDHSQRFVDWVNGMGLEQTFFGAIAKSLETRFKVRHLSVLFLFALALAFVAYAELDLPAMNYKEGDVLHSDVRSPVSFEMLDLAHPSMLKNSDMLPPLLSVKKGQIIIRAGTPVELHQLMILEEIKRRKAEHKKDLVILSTALLFVSMVLVFVSYFRRYMKNRLRVNWKDGVAMSTIIVISVVISKLVIFLFTAAFQDKFDVPLSAYMYMAPIAAGPMLVGMLIPYGEFVWIFTLLLSTILSLTVDQSFNFFIFSMVAGIAGARGVVKCKARNDIYIAGIRAGLVAMVVIAFLTGATNHEPGGIEQLIFWNSMAGLSSGVMSSLICMMLIPLLESIFNYTTDVKLLELSNLNHPLLRDMIVKAPGTYHHSLVVGSMVEAAAEEIGANPLLAKVSSYYHDIGKMEHSGYFIENQRTGNNPHDHLSPHMSKTVLVAHVKDGVELGEKYKLGQPIIDVIRQHHGTTLISFFYHKAKESEDHEMHAVTEDEFRYPGPKPQFKEAALSMLADSIEAASRSLDEPNPVRLQNIVKNIIHSKFMDGQLDECNLTLRDLSIIEASFGRILMGIYHQRIDYPQRSAKPPATA